MARRVQIEIEFEVGDDVTNEVIESIFADAFCQVDEAVMRSDDDGFYETRVETHVTAYAVTVDGTIIASVQVEPKEPTTSTCRNCGKRVDPDDGGAIWYHLETMSAFCDPEGEERLDRQAEPSEGS